MTEVTSTQSEKRPAPWRRLVTLLLIIIVVLAGGWMFLRNYAKSELNEALSLHDLVRIEATIKQYPTPILSTACRNDALLRFAGDDPETFRFLAENGASLNARDPEGNTTLHRACAMGNMKVIDYILSQGVSIDVRGANGQTPLHALALSGAHLPLPLALNVLDTLLKHDANINLPDDAGKTPIEHCMRPELIRAMLARGAKREDLVSKAKEPDALPTAAMASNLEMVKLYLEYGADINAKDSTSVKATALHYAVREKNLEMARFLLDHKADINARDWHDRTPLFYAQQDKNAQITALLKQHGGK